MPRAGRTHQAKLDIVEIALYIADRNAAAAERFFDLIDSRVELLATNPELGERRPELRADLRSFSAGNYVLFYRPIEDGIELVRVLHSARDLGAIFPGDQV